jgi:hypothetical protein
MTDDTVIPTQQIIEVETEHVSRASVTAIYTGGDGTEGLDLGLYLNSAYALTDAQIAAYRTTGTTGWTDVSEDLRRAFADAGDLGLPVDGAKVRGRYFIDPATPILVRKGSGFQGPDVARVQLSYASDGAGGIYDVLPDAGLVFVVDINSARKDVPKLALQGSTVTRKLQIAGIGLVTKAPLINVASYPAVTGVPSTHAPVICTDHRHNPDGTAAASAKAGGVTLEAHFVGLRQWAYIGDPLVAEESWAGLTASGSQTGISFTSLYLTGSTCERALGIARSTAGGLNAYIQAIPPYHTGLSQPNSGGLTNYAWLKYFQQSGKVIDWWHRAVGFNVEIQARGFRYGSYMQAGAGLGPAGQDTGKYNAGTIKFGVERVITLIYVHQDAYMHRVNINVGGHVMDEYNLTGEYAPMIDIRSHKDTAGAVDKAVYDVWVTAHDYSIGDKVSDGSGNVYACTSPGTSTTIPSGSTTFTDGDLVWRFRNGGFKPFGTDPFARYAITGSPNEISGRGFLNTANDGHVQVDMTGLSPANWSQAKTHYTDAFIKNLSPITVISHTNAKVFSSSKSKRVYDVVDESRLHVGGNDYFGYVLPVDGTDPPEIGGNLSANFFVGKNCTAYNFAGAGGDDDDSDEDE